jgi:hypothetical protein
LRQEICLELSIRNQKKWKKKDKKEKDKTPGLMIK